MANRHLQGAPTPTDRLDLEGVFLSPDDIIILGVVDMGRRQKVALEERINVRVSAELLLAVDAYAKQRGVSLSEAVRELLRQGLEVALGKRV